MGLNRCMKTLQQLAAMVGGRLKGDPNLTIKGVRPFLQARKGDITLAGSRRFLNSLTSTAASAVIVPEGTDCSEKNLLQVQNPKAAFARIVRVFHEQPIESRGVSSLASVGENCRIADTASVGPFAVLGDEVTLDSEVVIGPGTVIGDQVVIGAGSQLHANVTLYSGVSLGERVVVHSGSVIGADGFGYVLDGNEQVKMPQTGRVEIGDDVEIGANSCVDRATFGSTVLERGVKLDNHVHIGHNCRIGANTVIVGSVGISGSVSIGRNCVFAGQSGVSDHIQIGDNVVVMAKTAVTKDLPSGSRVSGTYGRDHRRQLKIEAILARLPEIYREWRSLKAALESAATDKSGS